MPKTRSSGNTIASRQNNSENASNSYDLESTSVGMDGNEEMSRRIDDRLQESAVFQIPIMSRTRNAQEIVTVEFSPETPGQATVVSASGNTYLVNSEDGSCTCPDYIHREVRCRHIEAVAIAQEEIPQGTTPATDLDSNINTTEVLNENINNEITEETHNTERSFIDDDHFYSDSPGEFDEELRRFKDEEIPYEYENALNGSDIKFGIELEFVNGDSDAIARELYNVGIVGEPRMVRYHANAVEGKWKLERDGSVTDGMYGGELVSPILNDTPETWRQIEKICEVARRHGATVNNKTGGHVHVSADPLDGKRQRWRRLFKAFEGSEEAIFRFSGGELGKFRDTVYAASSRSEMIGAINTRLPQEGDLNDFRWALDRHTSGIYWEKYRSINLQPFTNGTRDAIEIRAFNGTLTPGIIQANVKVAAGLIHTAERSRTSGQTTPSLKRRGEMIDSYGERGKNNKTVMRMLDTFFTRKSDKEHVLSVIAKNRW